jgi:CRP-like cAMP-binding protein
MAVASSATLPQGFRSTFLEGLTPSEIKVILAAARQERISPRQVLQREGDPPSRLCLLVTGRVAFFRHVPDGGRLFLDWGVPGDTFGLATIVRELPPYLVTVEAVQEGSILTWGRASSQALVVQYPNLSRGMNSVMTRYLDDVIDVLAARSFQTAEQRLMRILLKSARQIGRMGPEGIALDLTNEQLAEAAQVSLFTASRQLSEWEDRGILKKSRGKILLYAPHHLVEQISEPMTHAGTVERHSG